MLYQRQMAELLPFCSLPSLPCCISPKWFLSVLEGYCKTHKHQQKHQQQLCRPMAHPNGCRSKQTEGASASRRYTWAPLSTHSAPWGREQECHINHCAFVPVMMCPLDSPPQTSNAGPGPRTMPQRKAERVGCDTHVIPGVPANASSLCAKAKHVTEPGGTFQGLLCIVTS